MTGLTAAFIAAVTLSFTATAAGEPPLDLESDGRGAQDGGDQVPAGPGLDKNSSWLAQVMVSRVPSAMHVMPEQIDLDTCGGIVVHSRWVATAAHCISKDGKPVGEELLNSIKVAVGTAEYKPASPEELFTMALSVIRQEPVFYKYRDVWELSPHMYDVDKVVLHPNYNSKDNDIVLLRVMEDLPPPGDSDVSWLPLSTDVNFPNQTSTCFGFGWGCTSPGKKTAQVLEEISLPIVRSDICMMVTGLKHVQHKICAGFIYMNNTGLCKGDSGWPLVCRKGEHWIAAGLASMGFPKPIALPVIFTRLSHYVSWINDVVN